MNLIKQQVPFTQVSNFILYNSNLSLKAKGLYAYLYSKPEGWQFHYGAMAKELKESEETIRSILNELEKAKVLTKYQKTNNGKFGGIVVYLTLGDEQEICRAVKTPARENSVSNNTYNITNTESIEEKENILKEKDSSLTTKKKSNNSNKTPKESCLFKNSIYFSKTISDEFFNEYCRFGKEYNIKLDIYSTYKEFLIYYTETKGSNTRNKNWIQTWRNWIKNAKSYGCIGGNLTSWDSVKKEDKPKYNEEKIKWLEQQ